MATKKLKKSDKKKLMDDELGITEERKKIAETPKMDKGDKIKWMLAGITFLCLWVLTKFSA